MQNENQTETNIAASTSFERGNIYSWREVQVVHRTRNGIYHKNENLISLLTDFGEFNACYPDRVDEDGDKIYYTGNGRRGDQGLTPANRAMLAAIETKHKVPLFTKLKVGEWRFEGLWTVAASEYIFDRNRDRMIWRFALRRAKENEQS